MKAPPVTVLMTVWNGAAYIEEAVQSILNQTYRDFRFLILDNASADDTVQKIRALEDDRIDLVCLPENIGQTGALNQGLSLIESPLVARMDADDISHPDRLERQVACIQADDHIGIVGSGYRRVDAEGKEITRIPVYPDDLALRFTHFFRNSLSGSTVMFRHGLVWGELGGYHADYAIAQDYELVLCILKRARAAAVRDCLFSLRIHGENTSTRQKLKCAEDTRRIMRRNAAELLDVDINDPLAERSIDALFPPVDDPAERLGGIRLILREYFRKFPHAKDDPDIKREACAQYATLLEPWCNPGSLRVAWQAYRESRRYVQGGLRPDFARYVNYLKKQDAAPPLMGELSLLLRWLGFNSSDA